MSDIPYLLTWRPFNASSVFKFPDPDSGRVLEADTYAQLISLIVSYRAQNGYDELEHLKLTVDNYLCSLPENTGKCSPYAPLKRGVIATLKGAVAVVKSMMYKKFVSQEEADRRAEICKSCPNNMFPDRSYFVKWSDEIAEKSVGARKSKFHDALGSCSVCQCPLRCKVFYAGEIDLTPEQIEEMNKVNCWQPSANK